MKATLKITDTNYNVFDVLLNALEGKTGDLDNSNLIFCEEKISLMAERRIAERFGGSFNTDVYSFGNFLRVKKNLLRVLSKEGSAMAIRKVISELNLKCFSKNLENLAPSLYNLIVLLKSAKVEVQDLENAMSKVKGVLKNKLTDVIEIYKKYSQFLDEQNLFDQSSVLSYLPDVLETDEGLKNSDVFLVGYSSFTEQARNIVKILLKNAKSVTAILVGGDNDCVYVNESVESFKRCCVAVGATINVEYCPTVLDTENKAILKNLFNPSLILDRVDTDRILTVTANTPTEEVEVLASTIKKRVINGNARYRDFTVAIPNNSSYGGKIRRVFSSYGIPYFLDEKKKPTNNPLIRLVISYMESFRKNLERESLAEFYKNPLFCDDKNLSDRFYAYVTEYGINFARIKQPFKYGEQSLIQELENFRQKILCNFENFDIHKLLSDLSVKEKLQVFSNTLKDMGEIEESEVNEQIYEYVNTILNDMDVLLSGVKISYTERKRIFISGVNALELSIIPQYKDAVFVGGFKEASLAKANCLYVLGLTEAVPETKADVAIFNDNDIGVLSNSNVIIEPNIKIVNDREKENFSLALASFNDKLVLSYPIVSESGKKNFKSRLFDSLADLFNVKEYFYKDRYLTFSEGVKAFAMDVKRFADSKITDFDNASEFYHATKGNETVDGLLYRAQKTVDGKLKKVTQDMPKYISSPTAIEEFYSCPYRAFISRILRVKESENGNFSGLVVGNFLHDVMNGYLSRYSEITDENSFNKVIEEEILRVISCEEYSRHIDGDSKNDLERVIKETKAYATKTQGYLNASSFKPSKLEKSVSLKLLDGKATLYGKIDRLDECDEYYRVIDYKTGEYDVSAKALFSGDKLQLYLYSAMAEQSGATDKKLAGTFYAPINQLYLEKDKKVNHLLDGKVLEEKDVLKLHGEESVADSHYIKLSPRTKKSVVLSAEALKAHVKYAIKMCENAIEDISNGFIASSPLSGACKYCKFSGACDKENFIERQIQGVSSDTVVSAIEGGEVNE